MKVTIYSGVPGSGKSTIIRRDHPGAIVCSADHWYERNGSYLEDFNPAELPKAHGACLLKFARALEHGFSVLGATDALTYEIVVDNTNTTAVEIAPYAALALAYGANLEIVTVQCDPEVAAARNSHGVPRASVLAMADRIAKRDLPPWWPHRVIVNG